MLVKSIKKIPRVILKSSLRRLLAVLRELQENDYVKLIRWAIKYPPATRALFGALQKHFDKEALTMPIHKPLDPITSYKLSGIEDFFSSAKNGTSDEIR